MSIAAVRSTLLLSVILLLALAVAGLAAPPAAADTAAGPTWADAEDATIRPGVQAYTDGAQCTTNFVFHDATDIYIGYAAHCAGTGGSTDTDGCLAGSLPLGTPVELEGASQAGTLAYSSWQTMADVGETDPDTCAYNDFALVRIHPDDHASVNPTVPIYGGPQGINTDGTTSGEQVYSYGNSSLRLGLAQLSPKTGFSLGSSAGGWTHNVYTLTPGIPGDSGSAFLDSQGRALGVLSTLQIAPVAGSNGVSDVHRALTYANSKGGLSVTLAEGTEPFSSRLGLLGIL